MNSLGNRGFGQLKKQIDNYNKASQYIPFMVLTDLDNTECPVTLINQWLNAPMHPNFLFRVAVREVESWILAHRAAFATYLGISKDRIPPNPDELDDPKQALINLARKARKRELREGIVPSKRSSAPIGPGYNSLLREFVIKFWDVKVAEKSSPSLYRANRAIKNFNPILPSPVV